MIVFSQVETHIFAVGGCRSDGTVLYSIERYNTETDQWSSVGLMQVSKLPFFGHSVSVLHHNTVCPTANALMINTAKCSHLI
jgi:hypothetical protein